MRGLKFISSAAIFTRGHALMRTSAVASMWWLKQCRRDWSSSGPGTGSPKPSELLS